MIARLAFIACMLFMSVVSVSAQEPPMQGPPVLVLTPPPGTERPEGFQLSGDPEEARQQLAALFFDMMDVNADGALSKDELTAWVVPPGPFPPGTPPPPPPGDTPPGPFPPGTPPPPPPGDMPPGTPPPPPPTGAMPPPGEGMKIPPECSPELSASELLPQKVDVPCGETTGNLVFRTVCNADCCRFQAISLPAGRTASCFRIESMTGVPVLLTITKEADGTVVYDSRTDGLENIGTLVLTGEAVYRIEMLSGSDPGARATVAFVDHP